MKLAKMFEPSALLQMVSEWDGALRDELMSTCAVAPSIDVTGPVVLGELLDIYRVRPARPLTMLQILTHRARTRDRSAACTPNLATFPAGSGTKLYGT
jgi:hypothetical protein